jgi:hypothetical protein
MNLTGMTIPYEFIYGIGVEGLTPFEFALADKAAGDHVVLPLEVKTLPSTFKHLTPPIDPGAWKISSFYLTVQVVAVLPADGRDIVRAMAQTTGCDDGCCGEGGCGHGPDGC